MTKKLKKSQKQKLAKNSNSRGQIKHGDVRTKPKKGKNISRKNSRSRNKRRIKKNIKKIYLQKKSFVTSRTSSQGSNQHKDIPSKLQDARMKRKKSFLTQKAEIQKPKKETKKASPEWPSEHHASNSPLSSSIQHQNTNSWYSTFSPHLPQNPYSLNNIQPREDYSASGESDEGTGGQDVNNGKPGVKMTSYFEISGSNAENNKTGVDDGSKEPEMSLECNNDVSEGLGAQNGRKNDEKSRNLDNFGNYEYFEKPSKMNFGDDSGAFGRSGNLPSSISHREASFSGQNSNLGLRKNLSFLNQKRVIQGRSGLDSGSFLLESGSRVSKPSQTTQNNKENLTGNSSSNPSKPSKYTHRGPKRTRRNLQTNLDQQKPTKRLKNSKSKKSKKSTKKGDFKGSRSLLKAYLEQSMLNGQDSRQGWLSRISKSRSRSRHSKTKKNAKNNPSRQAPSFKRIREKVRRYARDTQGLKKQDKTKQGSGGELNSRDHSEVSFGSFQDF